MDNGPSPAAESSENERGIFDLGSRFVPIYREIGRGAKEAMGKRWNRDEWWDLLQKLGDEAWLRLLSNPECFTTESARHWASQAASHRLRDGKRNGRRHAIRDAALERHYAAGNFDAKAVDAEIEEQERAQAVHRGLDVLKPNRRQALIALFFRGLTRREAAAEAGTSERAVRRAADKGLRDLALELSHLDPRASRDATKRGDHA